MNFSKLTLAASAIILSTAIASPASAETCTDALAKAKASINFSALSSEKQGDFKEIVSAATKAQAKGDSSLCFEKVANLNDEFDMDAAAEKAEKRAESIRDRAEMTEERAENRAERIEERVEMNAERKAEMTEDRLDRQEARADANFNANANANANDMAKINASANSALNADADTLLVRDIDGMTIYNTSNAKIGKVRSVVENSSNGQNYLVVRQGGFFGLGGKDYLVPADQVMYDNSNLAVSSLNSTKLDGYTRFDRADNYIVLDANQKADALISINR